MSDKILLDNKRGKQGDCVHEAVKMKDSTIDPTRIMSDRIVLDNKRGNPRRFETQSPLIGPISPEDWIHNIWRAGLACNAAALRDDDPSFEDADWKM
jgi:hypothetical protein